MTDGRHRRSGPETGDETPRSSGSVRICRAVAARLHRPAALPPPRWLRFEGLAVGFLGTAAIVVCGASGVLAGLPRSQAGAAGMVAALALTVYLLVTKAGRLLSGAVAALGLALALLMPQVATELTLAGRGEQVEVVVTAVDLSDEDRGRYLCSVQYGDGTPVNRRIWRGCTATVTPGSSIGMVYDPKGLLAPHGIGAGHSTWRLVGQGAGLAALLAVLSYAAVVRSIRREP
ncbi:hypothetical protein [Streptomyces sp. KLOTTS4A1]|uniref:hypothetical protein n=1 Tax=Streptomyces sp. KLOTTS4A1 TaxID=3390996 RepID=UPI0039F61248